MRLKDLFFQFDKDHSGDISRDEFKAGLKETGIQMSEVADFHNHHLMTLITIRFVQFNSISFQFHSNKYSKSYSTKYLIKKLQYISYINSLLK